MSDALVVLCTFPSEELAARIATELIDARVAACVNLVPKVRSIYRWQDEVCDEVEVLAVCKTTTSSFEDLRDALIAKHPYDCPEVLALPVDQGNLPYLEWLSATVQPPSAP